jgi:hypothetical protein
MPDSINGWRKFILPTPFHDIGGSSFNLLNFIEIMGDVEVMKNGDKQCLKDLRLLFKFRWGSWCQSINFFNRSINFLSAGCFELKLGINNGARSQTKLNAISSPSLNPSHQGREAKLLPLDSGPYNGGGRVGVKYNGLNYHFLYFGLLFRLISRCQS